MKILGIDIGGTSVKAGVLTPDGMLEATASFSLGDAIDALYETYGYYRNAQSLILSARGISDGKRWETIEVDLRDFKIKQCYGYGDKFTEKHKQILNLVNKNMYQIRQRATMAS